jgi:hypothetical protein
MSRASLSGKLMLFSVIVCLSLFLFEQGANGTMTLSLTGDKDGPGTGIPFGAPVATLYCVNTPSVVSFVQRKTTLLQWTHSYDLPWVLQERMDSGKRV